MLAFIERHDMENDGLIPKVNIAYRTYSKALSLPYAPYKKLVLVFSAVMFITGNLIHKTLNSVIWNSNVA